jgi:hypothetical protein
MVRVTEYVAALCRTQNLFRIVALACLGAMGTPNATHAQSMNELLKQQRAQQEKRLDQILKLMKPLVDCVKNRAHSYELVSSPENADVAARAAVGLCSKEEGAYRSALSQLALVETDFPAASKVREMHDDLVEAALTIIVRERQRQRTAEERQEARNETETQRFKKGCGDFVAGRMTGDAFYCVSVIATAMELVVIFQGEGGTKGLNICIPDNPDRPLLTKDYAKLVNQRRDLMDDNQPISVGLIRILAREFSCANR